MMVVMGSLALMEHGTIRFNVIMDDRLYLTEEQELHNGMIVKIVQTLFQVTLQ